MRCKYIVRPAGRQWEVFNVTHARVIDKYATEAAAKQRVRDLALVQQPARL
jgi:hypothetical protein